MGLGIKVIGCNISCLSLGHHSALYQLLVLEVLHLGLQVVV